MVKPERKEDKHRKLNIILISCIIIVILRRIIIVIFDLSINLNVRTNIAILIIGLIVPIFLIIYITKRVCKIYLITGLLAIGGLLEIIARDMLNFDVWEKLFAYFPLPATLLLINYILMIVILILSFYLWKKASK